MLGPSSRFPRNDPFSTTFRKCRTGNAACIRVRRWPRPPRAFCAADAHRDIADVRACERGVGPVLHVVRYKREGLDAPIDGINAFGYGLTFGLHSRIEETVVHVTKRIDAGNIYVNRNMIGAAVGVQPFGGSGFSGTGPKAGGPFYLARLLAGQPARTGMTTQGEHSKASTYAQWLAEQGHSEAASTCRAYIARSPLGTAKIWRVAVG
jgi:RHH-type proline utilization regulon transcriptional repressor/proline dehydrogenase/delta 1-pyrroline-5-carboxylate dehydrogenase